MLDDEEIMRILEDRLSRSAGLVDEKTFGVQGLYG